MPRGLIILLTIITMTVAACDKSKSPNTATKAQTPTTPNSAGQLTIGPTAIPQSLTPTYTQAMYTLQLEWLKLSQRYSQEQDNNQFSYSWSNYWCAPNLNCQDRVVMVHISAGPKGGGTCTGVLVAADVVLTNRHCAELVVQKPYERMAGTITVTVPYLSKENQLIVPNFSIVKDLIAVSPTNFRVSDFNPDYAFLRLTKTLEGVQPVKMNFEGLKNGETYFIYGTSPYGDTKDKSAIEKRSCKAIYNTTFAPFWKRNKDLMVVFSDCPIGPSNSGSPIYNKDGELVGLIGGQLNPNTTHALHEIASGFFKVADGLSYIGWGTNLACMPDFRDLTKRIDADCDIAFKEDPKFAEISEQSSETARAPFNSRKMSDGKFQYTVQRANQFSTMFKLITQVLFLQVPKCIEKSYLNSLKENLQQTAIGVSGLKLTKNWEISSESTGLKDVPGFLDFDVSELKTKGATQLKVGFLEILVAHQSEISVCQEK